MRFRDVNTYRRIWHLSCSCACHSSLHAHVSIQDVGKAGGDHTALRPLDGLRRTRSDHRLPGGALPEAPPGLGHLKAHSSPIVNRQAEDGAAVDAPGVRRLVGECRVEQGRKRTGFHRKLTPLPPGPPPSPMASWAGCEVRAVRAGGPRLLYAFKNECPERDLSVLAFSANFRPPAFAVRFRPTETPVPGPPRNTQGDPRCAVVL